MPKSGKSSASSGTRKKHAARKAAGDGDELEPQKKQQHKPQRGQKKLSKAQRKALPKIKQYIPPPKPPAPPIPDPLDGQGLSRTLPADLVVVLRRLGKKDDVTRRKGLDELRDNWVALITQPHGNEEQEIQREIAEAAVISAIPVWLHNLASLLQSPFHRSQALQLHGELLAIPAIRGVILDALSLGYLPGTQDRDIIGSWLVAALEEGKRAGGAARRVWDGIVRFGSAPNDDDESQYTSYLDLVPHLSALAEYLSLSTLDPATLHRDIHPAPVQSVYAAPATKQKENNKGGKGGKGRPTPPVPVATPTPPPEEDSEIAEERWARYRVGGLVGLAWLVQQLPTASVPLPEELSALLSNPVLWSSLGTTWHLPDIQPIGQQPPIRRAAYLLLAAFVEAYPTEVEKPELLQLLSATVLGNCWAEREAAVWEAAGPSVIKFLTKFRQAWQLAESSNGIDEDDDDEDDDADEEGEGDATEPPSRDEAGTPAPPTSSKAFDAFLTFISTICPSVPHLTYPLLLVVVSTFPPSLLPLSSPISTALQTLFSHLWSPVDARLLSTHSLGSQPSAFQAFLQAALDVTVFLVEKAQNAGETDTADWLVKEQLGDRVWGEGVALMGAKGGRRGAAPIETEAKMSVRPVDKLVNISPSLADLFMAQVQVTTLATCFGDKPTFLARSRAALTELRVASTHIETAVDETILKIAEGCTERLFQLVADHTPGAEAQVDALVDILRARKDLFPPQRVEVLSQGLQAHIPELVALPPSKVAALFDATVAVASEADKAALLTALWSYVESDSVAKGNRFALAHGVIQGSTSLVVDGRLDAIATEATRSALAVDDGTALSIASAAVVAGSSLSVSTRTDILSLVSTVIHDRIDALLMEGSESAIPITALAILAAYAKDNMAALIASDECIQAVVAVHHLVDLLPRLERVSVPADATKIWSAARALPAEPIGFLSAAVSRSLAELLGRVSCRVPPSTLVDVALATDLGLAPTPANVATTILPPATTVHSHLERHTAEPHDPTLPVIDPLVPISSDLEAQTWRHSDFDSAGRSRAARFAEAALVLLRANRSLVETMPSLLNVAIGAMLLASDGAAIPGASRGLYSHATPAEHLEEVVRSAEGVLSFSLSLVDEAPLAWHKAAVDQLKAAQLADSADYLQRLLFDLRTDVAAKTSDVAPRAFREVLSRHLRKSGAGEKEGEVWLTYAMQMSEKLPELALAIILAIKPFMHETKAFETAQNRLANALTGISVQKANEKGLPALRLLVASAPPPDSTSLFIPQQRAVFALRHVGGWLTSDDEAAEDLSDEVDVRVAEMYTALAPIVQDLEGGHWDAIFDLIEGALGSCSMDDLASYPLMYAGLNLLREVRDLCATNKSLRARWTMKDEHLALVVKLFLQARDADSVPQQLIHALILDLLSDASEKVMTAAGLSELCDLLSLSSSSAIQTTAYRLLSQVIKSRTLALVLEVETEIVTDDVKAQTHEIRLPAELVAIVEAGRGIDWEQPEPAIEAVMAQLLAWMAVMDHFDDASRTLRWAYLDQLNTSRLLEESLLPLLFTMLGVSEVGAWNFPANSYAVDEFYCDLLVPDSLPDLTPLGSHLFYRALVTIPSAMRTYYESLKDRQLSLSLVAFVSRYYSSVIIAHEFSALREPSAMAELTDEGLSVRIAQGGGTTTVAGAGAAEAIASYVVDEQPMEIGIRLPAEFPLKGVDVRDLRRVGVPENKWRGWLMSVQQTITSRNGLILEALTVFKKNVALHFEGVVECAICYSIISVTDRTLPTKPCRTCKNRFHASCLFKWFNSSHSSSCPMCRSLF